MVDNHVFYRADENAPSIEQDQVAVGLSDADFMIYTMLKKILRRLDNG